ncbi:nuclear transport factor 2 family protein [Kibdelosporangium aridum]|uniref:SnoaL-like domain-containing protein n=1 Tax=Kibdelosporangium aridum TaxID=2030 RepID=A0A1W2FXB9_KIBAR|nr:nuclear transport factor 2 family protein [Kibdelosporangium aridum]SMD26392.1 SnoaL-like domain-containing protein [Kibdelosporangium aridum]
MVDTVTDLDRLVITDEIRQLMAWYVYHADHKDWGKLARLFMPDAIFSVYGPNGELFNEFTGPKDIEETITKSVGSRQAIHHLFSYTTVVHSATSASSVVNMEDLIGPPAEGEEVAPFGDVQFKTMHGFGHYRGDFVKTAVGWRISKLVQTRLKIEFTH